MKETAELARRKGGKELEEKNDEKLRKRGLKKQILRISFYKNFFLCLKIQKKKGRKKGVGKLPT